jgi:hypothetical protein
MSDCFYDLSFVKTIRFKLRKNKKTLTWGLESLMSDCFYEASSWDGGRTGLEKLMDNHVQYVKAKMTPKMRRTRALTISLKPMRCCIYWFVDMEALLVV